MGKILTICDFFLFSRDEENPSLRGFSNECGKAASYRFDPVPTNPQFSADVKRWQEGGQII
jgi:hypothetical protein